MADMPNEGPAAEYVATTILRHRGPVGSARISSAAGVADGICLACEQPILATGQPVTLIAIGTGDPEAQERLRAGQTAAARAIVVHAACAGR